MCRRSLSYLVSFLGHVLREKKKPLGSTEGSHTWRTRARGDGAKGPGLKETRKGSRSEEERHEPDQFMRIRKTHVAAALLPVPPSRRPLYCAPHLASTIIVGIPNV